jgi:outer membrane receptor protein involved in Fe transport
MKKLLAVIIMTIVLFPTMLLSQSSGKISGTILNEEGAPLGGANVIIEETSYGGASAEDGKYYILDVPVGTHIVRVDYIGYKSVTVKNVKVSESLTTTLNLSLEVSALEGEVVEIVADRPIINRSATNTTRLIDKDVIKNMVIRGVENIVALQTGAVAVGGGLYVRGSRAGDMAYYVDGVYTVNPFTLGNTGVVSNNAMEQISFQSGGFDAQFGNSNGGVVNTTTRTGSDKTSMGVEYVADLGGAASTDKDELHSYGYNLMSFNVGGPLGGNLRYFGSFERISMDDASPSTSYYPTLNRATGDSAYGAAAEELGALVEVTDPAWHMVKWDGDTAADTATVYSGYQRLYGAKENAGLSRDAMTGNLVYDAKAFSVKVGGAFTSKDSRGDLGESIMNSQGDYPYSYTLLNAMNTPYWESATQSMYANFTLRLGSTSFAKVNLSSYNYSREYGDHRHRANVLDYGKLGVTGNEQLISVGRNPLPIEDFAYFSNYGGVYNEYRINDIGYVGARADYLNQMGDHEIKTGFEWRKHTIRSYALSQPMELADGYAKAALSGQSTSDADWLYTLYRNAYTDNIGYDMQGATSDSYDGTTGATAPGEPVILGVYVQDKMELDDLVLNIGIRYDSFDFGSEAPTSWNDIYMKNGRIDHAASGYATVDAYTYLSPRVGVAFPVTDKTVLHAQYGKFVQHPILNRLYLSDSEFAANLTQGNMTVSPNGGLKPERTTQYEIGFAQQIGGFAAIDLTAYYKEIRDYTMMSNRVGSMVDAAEFSWSQYMNGDYGVVKGLSAALKMRRMRGVLIDVNYTMQWANGTGSDPATNFNIAWIGDNYPTSVNPLDFDQRHTGSVMVDYQAGKVFNLFDLGVNALYQVGSGAAYTPSEMQSAVFGRGWYRPTAGVNSAYKPWTSTMDLRINFSDFAGTGVSAYLLVLNALNTENVNSVYEGTGNVGEDGWLETSEGQIWSKGNPLGATFYEDRLKNPIRWDNPRMIRFGLSYSL